MNIAEVRAKLQELALATPVIDAHTHVQDDLTGFTPELAAGNLAGTQAAVNRPSAQWFLKACDGGGWSGAP
jgi:hypothetical protein